MLITISLVCRDKLSQEEDFRSLIAMGQLDARTSLQAALNAVGTTSWFMASPIVTRHFSWTLEFWDLKRSTIYSGGCSVHGLQFVQQKDG